jgi:glycosyltransferase involved in cell wall biosynthesis
MNSKRVLLVIIPDRLSVLFDKGEITDCYYNPGELFEEVHILMTNDDSVNPENIQKTVGKARLYVHSLGSIPFIQTLGWRRSLMKPWQDKAIALAQTIQPSLIRAYGNYINGYFAVQVKKHLNIPLVVSLHARPDLDERAWAPLWPFLAKRLFLEFQKRIERETLKNSDCVIAVYESIREYALNYGAKRVEIIYNVINATHLRRKISYQLHNPPRVISIGRQHPRKNPENLIRAIVETNAELTLVGKGPCHETLKSIAREYGVTDRVIFKPAISNDDLCEMLSEYDIWAVCNDFMGISKSAMEALMTGLPVITNRSYPAIAPELNGAWVMVVENTKDGYLGALRKLLFDDKLREHLGKHGYDYAWKTFAPFEMEQNVVNLYQELVPGL